jgi:hypothetical protein
MLERWLRPGADSSRDVLVDLLWLVGFALLLMGVGLGLRDPWPADEPRFALVARDMLRSGDWLIPRVGGNLYGDKPPVFFWLMAAAMGVTGSLRVGFLLPSTCCAASAAAKLRSPAVSCCCSRSSSPGRRGRRRSMPRSAFSRR